MKFFYLLTYTLFIISCADTTTNKDESHNLCPDTFTKSSKNGYTKEYYENVINLKSIGHYKNGIPDGFWKHFYRNGTVKSEGHYNNGKRQGFWKEYHKNGAVKSEGHIDNCKPIGYWKFYNCNTTLIKEVNH